MTTHWDAEYKATKLIKQGEGRMIAPFDEIAGWIARQWEVAVLNVIYDARNSLHGPRLQVILERKADLQKLGSWGGWGDVDQAKERAIKERFMELVAHEEFGEFDTEGLFVVFSAFAPLALQEADDRISENELQALQQRIGEADLWQIHRCFGHVTFFFYTAGQVRRHAEKEAAYSKMYLEVLKPHDEFGYLEENGFSFAFDSKENFDENYQGSWFNYDR